MPELPEVEYGRRLLEVYAVGKRISSVIAENDDKIFSGVPAAAIREKLSGKTIVASRRLGKHIWLELDNRPWPSFHFGMTGAFSVKGSQAMKYKEFTVDTSAWPPKFTKFLMKLEGGDEIAFSDPRRFSRIRVLDDPEHSPPISELGFDALLAMPTLEEFSAKLRARTAPVKAVLLDQSFSAGVGNWVADEILYQARVHPSHRASQLSDRQVATLRDKMAYVLETAVGHNADSSFFPSDWMFHMRWGKGRAGAQNGSGHKVAFITVGGRTTAFVPSLQKLSPGQAAEAVEGGEGEGDEVEGAVAGGSVGKGSKKVGARKAVGGSKGSEKGQEKTTPKRKKAGGVVPGDVVVEGELTSSAVTKKTAAPRGRKNNGGATTEHEMQKGEGKRASFPASEDAADVVLTADDAPGAAGVRLAAKGGRARSRGKEAKSVEAVPAAAKVSGRKQTNKRGNKQATERGNEDSGSVQVAAGTADIPNVEAEPESEPAGVVGGSAAATSQRGTKGRVRKAGAAAGTAGSNSPAGNATTGARGRKPKGAVSAVEELLPVPAVKTGKGRARKAVALQPGAQVETQVKRPRRR